MYKVRLWSVRNARWLNAVYHGLESVLSAMHPLLNKIGYQRLDAGFLAVEKVIKGFLFDSQSCGQCTLGSTGMACPMNCPKTLRNGPCGGVRLNGKCEVRPDMNCVWVTAWEGSQKIPTGTEAIQVIQQPVDVTKKNTSAWLRAVRNKHHVEKG